jgi:hypothetical protein
MIDRIRTEWAVKSRIIRNIKKKGVHLEMN